MEQPQELKTDMDPSPTTGPTPRPTIPLEHLDDSPRFIDCPFCEQKAWTKIVQEHSDETKRTACLCCFCVGVFGVWMPFVFRWHQHCHHLCTNCEAEVAFKPNGRPVEVRRPAPKGGVEVPYVSPEGPKPPPADHE
ncbi:hypothetical protein FE257_003534 [Aspergillus nanangensis]|uniref:LITAF domain-containing protein n=1 Tax=Aspergillus nanangensis TaxID=2582783 RepID=A0AAD4CCR8_ASPNN|nr:hypothetical protein FE257_003534 [Aspergillus nanangensis]